MTNTFCEICGAELPEGKACIDLYHELAFYTLSHRDPVFFIHQYIVDAYAASHASQNAKPITTAFALAGLYLFVTHNYTGKEVQNMHMNMAQKKREWPIFELPAKKANITVSEVLKAEEGGLRDEMIKQWARAVWEMWKDEQVKVAQMMQEFLIRG